MHALSLPAAPIPFSLSFPYLVLPSVPHPPLSSFLLLFTIPSFQPSPFLPFSLLFRFSTLSIFPPFLFYSYPFPPLPCLLLPSLPIPLTMFSFFSTDPPLPLSVSSLPSRFLPFLPRGGLSMACCRFCSSSALPAVSSYSAMLCWSGTSYSSMSVCVCVCLSVVVVLSKRLNKSRWFWHAFFHASYTLL